MVITPSSESTITFPLAGTVTENQTSPPAYPAHPGAGTPADAVAAAFVYCVNVHVVPTVNGVALHGLSFIGAWANTDIHESNRRDKLHVIRDMLIRCLL